MAHIAIFGATRGIGRATVDEALARGHRVRAISRSAGRLDGAADQLEGMSGDALDEADVRRGVAGTDAVIQALGVKTNLRLFTGPISLFSEATRVLLPAMKAAGIDRLVTVTGFGAGESRKHMALPLRVPFELVLGRAYADKGEQERMIEASELRWTIARPGKLTDGAKSEHYEVLRDPEAYRYGAISRRDVAHFLVGQVEDPTAVREAPVLA